LNALLTHGLRVDSINGAFAVQPVQATDDPGCHVDEVSADCSVERDGRGDPCASWDMETQIGAVVCFGQEADVPTPLFTFIYHSLLPMELRA